MGWGEEREPFAAAMARELDRMPDPSVNPCEGCERALETVNALASHLREILADLTHRTGQYIETDERPRPRELWAAMFMAQDRAAVFLNTGEDTER